MHGAFHQNGAEQPPHLQHNWVKAGLKAINLERVHSGLRAFFLDLERNSSDLERDLERILNFLAVRAVSVVLGRGVFLPWLMGPRG